MYKCIFYKSNLGLTIIVFIILFIGYWFVINGLVENWSNMTSIKEKLFSLLTVGGSLFLFITFYSALVYSLIFTE